MSRRYLRSNGSKHESKFFTCGKGLYGEENFITDLFKMVGKFNELSEFGQKEQIRSYVPSQDRTFKYENRGYTDIGAILRYKYAGRHFSRKCLKTLSRKWLFTPVLISFECARIISELITYINHDDDLSAACKKYAKDFENNWAKIMPIQYDFLSTRHTHKYKDFRIAGEIINALSNMGL